MQEYSDNFKLKGLLYVHHAVRRDTNLFYQKMSHIENVPLDQIPAIIKWFHKFEEMLHTHHSSEDNIFFPALISKEISLKGVIDSLEEEHIELDNYLENIDKYLHELEHDIPEKQEIYTKLKDLSQLLLDHILTHATKEEDQLIPATINYLSHKEQESIENKLHRHVSLFKIPYLISWMMYGLDKKDKKDFYNSLPRLIRFLYTKYWEKNFEKAQKSII